MANKISPEKAVNKFLTDVEYIKDIKKAVAKAIEVLLSKLDANDSLKPDLFDAHAAFTSQ